MVQRLGLTAIHDWAALVALGLVAWSRERPLAPLTSQDGGRELDLFRFLATESSGDGEVAYSWWARRLRLPSRFRFTRRTAYEGSALWLVDDVLRYENGLTYKRSMLARPLSAERMHLTSDAIPGGANTVLVPGGLVLEPAWFIAPYWGIPWPLRCRGLLRGDGRSTSGSFEMDPARGAPVGRLGLTFEVG